MKKITILLTALFALAGLTLSSHAAERYYGTITAVDDGGRSLTVHNKKRKQDARFLWTDSTEIVRNKQPFPASQLKDGQFLMVSYDAVGDTNQAKKIVVRELPGRKKSKAQ